MAVGTRLKTSYKEHFNITEFKENLTKMYDLAIESMGSAHDMLLRHSWGTVSLYVSTTKHSKKLEI